jgi:AcrR family transcriptional regulator
MKAKSQKGAKSRQKILDAAADLILKNGVNGTSVDDVLKAAGAGKSQFYHYFGSKDLMVRALISEQATRVTLFQEPRLDAIKTCADLEAWFDDLIAESLGGSFKYGCPIGNIGSELGAQNELLREACEISLMGWQQSLVRVFSRLKKLGLLSDSSDEDELAALCLTQIQGGLLMAKSTATSTHLQAVKSNVIRYIRSLQPRSGAYKQSNTRYSPRSPKTPLKREKRKSAGIGFCP